MLKVNNKSSNGVKENISWDVDLDVFSYIVIIPTKNSSWWRRLEGVLKTSFVFVFRRRLDQDEYVRLSLTSSEDVFKTSSRRFQDVFKTSSRRLAKTSSRRLAKTSSRRLAKTSSRSFAKISSRCFQDVSLS